jgi:hypothetical protein
MSPDGKVFIIPCRLEGCEVPESLRKWQWLDLFRRGGYSRLRHTLTVHLGRKSAATKLVLPNLTQFANPQEHFLFDLFERQGTFLYSRLPKRGYAVSQAHFMAILPKLNPAFKQLKGRIGDYRQLKRDVVEAVLPKNTPWRRQEFRVTKVSQPADRHFVVLHAPSALTAVSDNYWPVVMLSARKPEIYITSPSDPILRGAEWNSRYDRHAYASLWRGDCGIFTH